MRLARFVPLAASVLFGPEARGQDAPVYPVSAAPVIEPVRTSEHSSARTAGHDGALVGAAETAHAPPTMPPPPPPGQHPDEPRYTDAHVDRVIVLPTAETHPAGTVYFSSYDLVVLQAGYALSDRTQVSLTATPPFGDDGEYVFLLDGSLKTVVARERRVRVAALASVSGITGLEEGNFFLGRFGGVAQFCLDPLCQSSLNMATNVLLGGPATMNLTGIGGIWRVSRAVGLLLEANVLLPFGREVGRFNGIAIGPGVRLSWKSFAVDAAVEWVADAEIEEGERVPALPLLAVTYRVLH